MAPGRAWQGWARWRPVGAPGGSWAAPGWLGPLSWCSGGIPSAMGAAVTAAGSRDALPLALLSPRSISRKKYSGYEIISRV